MMRKFVVAMLAAALAVTCLALAGCGKDKGPAGSGTLTDFAVEGGTYTGTTTDGTATGTGTITYNNGNVYEGNVVKGLPEGDGIMLDAISEGTYTGSFAAGKYSDAEALLEFDNGGIYRGAFEAGKMKGNGTFTWPDGNVFVGVFAGTGGKEGSAGAINGTGKLSYVGGIEYEGSVEVGNPKEGKFSWPSGGPTFTGTFTNFLTGYGALDMKNGIIYEGPMGLGLLVPVEAWQTAEEKVRITYPENGDYHEEVFEGDFVFNAATNKDELVGTVTRKNGEVIDNVTVALDWSFSYRYTGTYEDSGIVYTGGMRDYNVPYGAGVYQWPNGGPTFTATENHGWLTGVGTLDMKNGITYEGPMNAIAAAKGGNEFQPYTNFANQVIDTVKITHPAGVFNGRLQDLGTGALTDGIKAFFGNATYLSEGLFTNANGDDVPFLFIPTFGMGLYPIMETSGTPVTVANLSYEGRYLVVDGLNIAYGKGVSYWATVTGAPRIESEFFYNNMTGLVKFYQTGYTYEGGMTTMVFGAECGVKEATVTFDNGDVFVGAWESGVLNGVMTYSAGGTAAGSVSIGLTECTFTAAA